MSQPCQHVLDPKTVVLAEGTEATFDCRCKHCPCAGSFVIESPTIEVNWEEDDKRVVGVYLKCTGHELDVANWAFVEWTCALVKELEQMKDLFDHVARRSTILGLAKPEVLEFADSAAVFLGEGCLDVFDNSEWTGITKAQLQRCQDQEEARMDMPRIRVDSEGFYWTAYIKHTPCSMAETHKLTWETLDFMTKEE